MEEESRHAPEGASLSRSITIPIDTPATHIVSGDSPLLTQSQARQAIDLNDTEAQERQRTMDVDLAMQMSRARRGSSSIPILGRQPSSGSMVFSNSPLGSSPEQGFSMLSPHEEEAMLSARSGGVAGEYVDHDVTTNLLHVTEEDHPGVSGSNPFNLSMPPHLSPSRGSDMLFSLNQDARPLDSPDVAGTLPVYQPTVCRSNFDYSHMEEFGNEEKRRLGISSPIRQRPILSQSRLHDPRKSVETTEAALSGLPTLNATEPATDTTSERRSDNESSLEFTRLRQRKLSQSNTTPGMRRGKSGKLALFEGNVNGVLGAPPPSFVPAASGLFLGAASDGRYAAGPSGWGIGSSVGGQGHDRPYRFSFYSNSLSATIHARSLSELPADGQTFEELFAGKRRSDGDDRYPTTGRGGASNAAKHGRGGMMPTPSLKNPADGTPHTVADGGLGPILDKKGRLPDNGMEDDWEINTWWLDILDPTDDEMRMLSKVRSLVYPFTSTFLLVTHHPTRRCFPFTR